jgi:hypothetical protein
LWSSECAPSRAPTAKLCLCEVRFAYARGFRLWGRQRMAEGDPAELVSGRGCETEATLRLAGARGRTRQHRSDTSTRQIPVANTPGRAGTVSGSSGSSRAHHAPFSFAALTRRCPSPPSPAQTTPVRSLRRPESAASFAVCSEGDSGSVAFGGEGRTSTTGSLSSSSKFEQIQAFKVAHELVQEDGFT